MRGTPVPAKCAKAAQETSDKISPPPEPRRFTAQPESLLLSFRLEPVQVQHAVQVIGLVLQPLRQHVLSGDGHRLVANVHPANHRSLGTDDGEPQLGHGQAAFVDLVYLVGDLDQLRVEQDRKSTRLNSSHVKISYAVFCLKKKKKT